MARKRASKRIGIAELARASAARNVRLIVVLAAVVVAAAILITTGRHQSAETRDFTAAEEAALRALPTQGQPRPGDFDRMMDERLIRVLVPYSRTLYFNDHGRERGITADLMRDFERALNRKYRHKLANRPITIVLVPAPRAVLIPGVARGFGDIGAGNLTATKERLRHVDFVGLPDVPVTVSEIVVTHRGHDALLSVNALAGMTVHVRKSSSYYASLQDLNARLQQEGKARVTLITVSDALEDEDLMELVEVGVIDAIVADDWKARLWSRAMPGIQLHPDAVLRTGGQIGWAIRKDSPLLRAEIEDFLRKHAALEFRVMQYRRRIDRMRNPTAKADLKHLQAMRALFEKYGEKYGFDPLLLAAQGFQESKLNQGARSRAGAIGVMQVTPATGRAMNVGNITQLEPNIHAGVKYLHKLANHYFDDPAIDRTNRTLLSMAAYNAGPTRVARLRREASDRGLDGNAWFDNVEIVVAERIGRETTTYVRNIYKYYVAYTLTFHAKAKQEKARSQYEEKKE